MVANPAPSTYGWFAKPGDYILLILHREYTVPRSRSPGLTDTEPRTVWCNVIIPRLKEPYLNLIYLSVPASLVSRKLTTLITLCFDMYRLPLVTSAVYLLIHNRQCLVHGFAFNMLLGQAASNHGLGPSSQGTHSRSTSAH